MRRVSILALILAAGCGSAPPITNQAQADLTRADALVLQGCYDCLVEARDIYERVAVGRARPLVITRLFEAQVLVYLREQELALDGTEALGRARNLAAELPAWLEAGRLMTIVTAIPGDAAGWPRSQAETFRRERLTFLPAITGEVAWLEAAPFNLPFRQYVALAIDCSYLIRPRPKPPAAQPGAPAPPQPPTAPPRGPVWPQTAAPDAPPLVTYRQAICRSALSAPSLERAREAVPPFVEISLFLGRMAAALAPGSRGQTVKATDKTRPKPRELVDEAYGRFPRSPAVTYLAGNFNQIIGDCRVALRYYDETLALASVHEDALLGRTICLAFLKRFDEAIETATRMIELRTDNIAYAFYWRAWIRHTQQQLDLARADINQAKTRDDIAEFFTLAGIIEYEQDDLDVARDDLVKAKTASEVFVAQSPSSRVTVSTTLKSMNCTAMWYLGLVTMKWEQWPESGGHFADAMECYETRVKEDEAGLASLLAKEDLEPEYRARQITGFEAAIKEDRSQQYAAAFNAANHYTRGGKLDRARALIEIAARDPMLADRVKQLRDIIK